MRNENRIGIFALCLALLLVTVSLAGCAAEPEEKGPTQAQLASIRQTAEEIALPYAELYGVNDMRFVEVEVRDFDAVCTFSSEQYAQLTPEEQLGFLADTLLSVYKQEPFPKESGISDKDFSLEVVSGENRYRHMTSSGSHLLVNGDFTLEKDTLYSDAVSDSLEKTMAKIEAHIQGSYDTMLEVAKLDPSVCPVCGTRYQEGSLGYIKVRDYGYCKEICGQKIRDAKGDDWTFQKDN